MRSCMAKSPASVERRAVNAGFAVLKGYSRRSPLAPPICANTYCVAHVPNEGDLCESCKPGGSKSNVGTGTPSGGFRRAGSNLIQNSDEKSDEKGKFRGYSRSNISDRPIRQAKNKTWTVSRKNKRGRTARRYQRNKSRGNVRPAMRRQLGAGGKRASTKR